VVPCKGLRRGLTLDPPPPPPHSPGCSRTGLAFGLAAIAVTSIFAADYFTRDAQAQAAREAEEAAEREREEKAKRRTLVSREQLGLEERYEVDDGPAGGVGRHV
jgi:hypothetical protein